MARMCKGFLDLEKYLEGRKRKFVNYKEGAEIYRIPYYSFVRLAKEADANYTLRKTAVIDVDLIEHYLDEGTVLCLIGLHTFPKLAGMPTRSTGSVGASCLTQKSLMSSWKCSMSITTNRRRQIWEK